MRNRIAESALGKLVMPQLSSGPLGRHITLNENSRMFLNKSLSLVGLLLAVSASIVGQSRPKLDSSIVGTWVEYETVGSDTDGDTYTLRKDGSFTFTYSGYHWAGRRIISFSGKYRLTKDSIYFQITETRELVGGYIDNDGPPNGLGWVVEGATKQVIKQPYHEPIGLDFSFQRDDYHKYIFVDKSKYMQVPRDQEKN
jgi:hypothetical protein